MRSFTADHLGSTNALTDNVGNVTEATSYDSFGNASSPLSTRYQFTGREFDNATGLQYSRNRWYAPDLGRFISEDPIGFAGGDANLYSYVGNNPLNGTDSLGLSPDGPVNYLRDPFPPEYWVGNGLSNTVSDLLGLDWVAQWGWTIGDHRCSFDDRLGAGAKLVGWTAFQAFGGAVVGKALGAAFKAIRPLAGKVLPKFIPRELPMPLPDKWSRLPKSLMDEMALEGAESGAGSKIIDNLGDPNFKGMEKWEYKVKSTEGLDFVIHYVRDPKTGQLMDFKFTKHSTDGIGNWAKTPEPKVSAGNPPSGW